MTTLDNRLRTTVLALAALVAAAGAPCFAQATPPTADNGNKRKITVEKPDLDLDRKSVV